MAALEAGDVAVVRRALDHALVAPAHLRSGRELAKKHLYVTASVYACRRASEGVHGRDATARMHACRRSARARTAHRATWPALSAAASTGAAAPGWNCRCTTPVVTTCAARPQGLSETCSASHGARRGARLPTRTHAARPELGRAWANDAHATQARRVCAGHRRLHLRPQAASWARPGSMHAIMCGQARGTGAAGVLSPSYTDVCQHLGDVVLAAAQRGDLRHARALRGALRAAAQLRQERRVRARALAVRERDLACSRAAKP
jgi:hypothetical protein